MTPASNFNNTGTGQINGLNVSDQLNKIHLSEEQINMIHEDIINQTLVQIMNDKINGGISQMLGHVASQKRLTKDQVDVIREDCKQTMQNLIYNVIVSLC